MAVTSLSARLASTLRSQSQALRGDRILACDHPTNGAGSASGVAPGAGKWHQSRESLVTDFEALLPVIAKFHGYHESDSDTVRRIALTPTDAGLCELEICVLQWRLDVVVYRLGGLAEDAMERAWIQFRHSVVGAVADEDGIPYTADALQVKAARD